MAKSKLQKREEALKRQHESFMTQHLPRLNEVATDKPYDAEHHALLYGRAVNAAHAANCDLHGNMLNCNFYRSGNSDNAQYMALNHTLYTLEEMKQITGYDGRSLYKLAYGTPPFVEKKEPYDINDAGSIDVFIKAGVDNISVTPNFLSGNVFRDDVLVMGAVGRHQFKPVTPFSFKSVIDSITIPSEPSEDFNRADIIMDATSTIGNQEVYDYFSGKISYAEALSISEKRAQKTDPYWNPEIDGAALLAFHHNKLSSETYLKIRARKENGLSDAECLKLINAPASPVLSPGSKWIADNF